MCGNTSNLEKCHLYRNGAPLTEQGEHLVTACNEVINIVNTVTNEVEYQIRPRDTIEGDNNMGYVTCLKVSKNLLAAGYSQGFVVVYDLDLSNRAADPEAHQDDQRLCFDKVHSFSLHRSGVTCIQFDENNTEMYSGAQDTYIVVYDLVADQAMYKLMGHRDVVTQLDVVLMASAQ